MQTVEFILDSDLHPQFDSNELAHLDAMTAEQIEAAAVSDTDNPPLTPDELARMASARLIRRVRQSTGLSQTQFATRFEINRARLRDLERGRTKADSALTAYLKVIAAAPGTVVEALSK